jgi:excisionase family DNA binding protein
MNAPLVDPLQLLTVADVAGLMCRSERWVREQYRSGALTCTRNGRSVRFRRADIEAFQRRSAPASDDAPLAQVITLRRAS